MSWQGPWCGVPDRDTQAQTGKAHPYVDGFTIAVLESIVDQLGYDDQGVGQEGHGMPLAACVRNEMLSLQCSVTAGQEMEQLHDDHRPMTEISDRLINRTM